MLLHFRTLQSSGIQAKQLDKCLLTSRLSPVAMPFAHRSTWYSGLGAINRFIVSVSITSPRDISAYSTRNCSQSPQLLFSQGEVLSTLQHRVSW